MILHLTSIRALFQVLKIEKKTHPRLQFLPNSFREVIKNKDLNRGEAEILTTCDTNRNDYENQTKKKQKIVFVKKKLQVKSKISGKKPALFKTLQRALRML